MKKAVTLIIVFAAFLAPNALNAATAAQWTEDNKLTMIQTCASDMVDIEINTALEREGIPGKDIPEKIKSRVRDLKATSLVICTCIIEKGSHKWSPEEMMEVEPADYFDFIMSLFCSKQCPIPSTPPYTCEQWENRKSGRF